MVKRVARRGVSRGPRRVPRRDLVLEPPGAPVQLTQDEVTALVRGQMPEDRIARILEARPVPVGPPDERVRKAKQAPVHLSAAELRAVTAGEPDEKVRARLEKAAGDRLKRVSRRKRRPQLEPPGEAGRLRS